MASNGKGFVCYIVSSNRLAAQYIYGIVRRDKHLIPVLCERLPSPQRNSSRLVFVLDGSYIPIPLGECLRRLKAMFGELRTVLIDRKQSDDDIVELLNLGVHGFVEHSKIEESLSRAIHVVANGSLAVSPAILECYVQTTSVYSRPQEKRSGPTPREACILELVRRRLSNREIAEVLGIQESTVKYHLSNVMGKLRVESRHELEADGVLLPLWKDLLHFCPSVAPSRQNKAHSILSPESGEPKRA